MRMQAASCMPNVEEGLVTCKIQICILQILTISGGLKEMKSKWESYFPLILMTVNMHWGDQEHRAPNSSQVPSLIKVPPPPPQQHPHEVYRGENKDRNLITVTVDCILVVRILIVPTVACECEVPRQMLTLYQSRALNAEYKSPGVQQLFTAASV